MAGLGIERGDTVLVHASMRALGTARRPEAVLEDLEAAVGPSGTLLLPALTYDVVTPERPVFDSEKTEPCVGLLPTTFWRMPDVVRSENPTHSVCAWGRLAHRLTVARIRPLCCFRFTGVSSYLSGIFCMPAPLCMA